jgi:hypothetical protein
MSVLGIGLALFFLSLFRLHRQMVAVKATELALARELYAQAYKPLRSSPTLEVLYQQHTLSAQPMHSRSGQMRSTSGRSTKGRGRESLPSPRALSQSPSGGSSSNRSAVAAPELVVLVDDGVATTDDGRSATWVSLHLGVMSSSPQPACGGTDVLLDGQRQAP